MQSSVCRGELYPQHAALQVQSPTASPGQERQQSPDPAAQREGMAPLLRVLVAITPSRQGPEPGSPWGQLISCVCSSSAHANRVYFWLDVGT